MVLEDGGSSSMMQHWNSALEDLRTRLSQENFETWLGPLRFDGFDIVGSSPEAHLKVTATADGTRRANNCHMGIVHHGIRLRGMRFDSMLESYVLNSVATRHDMDSVAKKYLHYDTVHFEDVAGRAEIVGPGHQGDDPALDLRKRHRAAFGGRAEGPLRIARRVGERRSGDQARGKRGRNKRTKQAHGNSLRSGLYQKALNGL